MNFSSAATNKLLPVFNGGRGSATPQFYQERGSADKDVVTRNLAELAVFPVREALKGLVGLPANWDGFGSDAPAAEAIGSAFQLIVEIYRQSASCVHASWVNPHVSASESGEVVFEWWKRDRKLTVYVSAGRAEFLRVGGPNIDVDMEDGELVGAQFVGLWFWLNA
ncbi:hypothetical protein [Paraburkholderia flava]|uniref:hypothetical protein n=1 Tax=Paraburkholderia flava TaxID=2547393 RepID=UPI00105FAE7B|nr:hypothetical protein [Paraburkholderia flava]